jgi:ABC-type spermidine/putrescine transport system permease subunit I
MDEKNNRFAQTQSGEHSRQTFWQIYFPLLLTGVGAGVIFFLLFGKPGGGGVDLRVWADISAILIILPLFIILFVLIALTLMGSAATHKISTAAKTNLVKIKQITVRISHGIVSVSNGIHKTCDELDALSASLTQKLFK